MILTRAKPVVYPESDGKPMADNTLQYKWITTIKGGLHAQFRDRGDVFVAGDLLWYPVEGDPKICTAPDTMVAFGRPPGYRPSYMQFREEHIPPQVVFEVLSHSNRPGEMRGKLAFYQKYGVLEYYVFDPYRVKLTGYFREGDELVQKPLGRVFRSPLLDVTFEIDKDLSITGKDGWKFEDYPDVVKQLQDEKKRTKKEKRLALAERKRADDSELRIAELERQLQELKSQLPKS